MSTSPARSTAFLHSVARRFSIVRALFLCTALYAGALVWIAPHPPMTDLAQHAGQVALLHDLLQHASPWRELVQINYFTPYLVGYGLALPLSYLMPVTAALKLMLTVAYYGFVVCCMLLRRRFGGDERLDWLFIPGFFGFAFAWGFYTFLVAAPLGLLFVLLVHTYAGAPSRVRAIAVLLAGIGLFFSHGLVFLFACAIGVGFVVMRQKHISRILPALVPLVLLGVLCIAYAIVSRNDHSQVALSKDYLPFTWELDWRRSVRFPAFVWGVTGRAGIFFLISAFMAAAPWLLGDRFNRRDLTSTIPLLVIVVVWFLAPGTALATGFLYHRFALFLMPAYALAFRFARTSSVSLYGVGRSSTGAKARDTAVQLLLMLGCWGFLGVQTERLRNFAIESAPFETLLASTVPGERALSMMFDRESAAFTTEDAYGHYPGWYQAERHGFVDVNFAWFLPQIVKFRRDQLPPVRPPFENMPQEFNWKEDHARMYRYFFVRKAQALPAAFFANDECDVALLRTIDEWSLYERRKCR
jgi:hypothetical protein